MELLTVDCFTLKITFNIGQPFEVTLKGKTVGAQISGTTEAAQGTQILTAQKHPS
jgi:hypothetical protein